MSAPRLYHPELQVGEVRLDADEARHASGALRLRHGDTVILFDGFGHEAQAQLTEAAAGRTTARIHEIRTVPRRATRSLTIAVSPPKQARQDTLVEKCTELGVAALWPMRLKRTVAAVTVQRLGRWRRIAISACKQSGQAWLPEIRPSADLATVLASAPEFDLTVVASPSVGAEPLPEVLQARPAARNVLVLVGPEGGLSPSEVAAIEAAGVRSCRLTQTVLRVETAAIAVAAVILSQPGVGQ